MGGGGGISAPPTTEADEVVLFCSGLRQLIMSVGVAHAYLVSGHRPDHIVGMSVGSLAAARLQQIFASADPRAELERWLATVLDTKSHLHTAWSDSWRAPASELDGGDQQVLQRWQKLGQLLAGSSLTVARLARTAQCYRTSRTAGRKGHWARLSVFARVMLDAFRTRDPSGKRMLRDAYQLYRDFRTPEVTEQDAPVTLLLRSAVRDRLVALLGEDWGPMDAPGLPSLTIAATSLATLPARPASEDADHAQVQVALDLSQAPLDRLLEAMWTPGLWPAASPGRRHELRAGERVELRLPSSTRIGDASLARSNPLPAFFRRIRPTARTSPHSTALSSAIPLRLRLVYADAFEERAKPLDDQEWPVATVAATAFRASRREDIGLEHRQTTITSLLLKLLEEAGLSTPTDRRPAEVSCIAPEHATPATGLRDAMGLTAFEEAKSGREVASQACRSLLEALYVDALSTKKGRQSCHAFLKAQRLARGDDGEGIAPISELCAHCTRKLRPPRDLPPAEGFGQYGPGGRGDSERSAHLRLKGERSGGASYRLPEDVHAALRRPPSADSDHAPRVVLLSEGGVLRGSFQVGAMAALGLLDLKPDIVAGASIGAGMGAFTAALFAAIARSPAEEAPSAALSLPPAAVEVLQLSARAYLEVEKRVIGTPTFDTWIRHAFAALEGSSLSLAELARPGSPATLQKVEALLGLPASKLAACVEALAEARPIDALRHLDDALATAPSGDFTELVGTDGLQAIIEDVLQLAGLTAPGEALLDSQPFLPHGMAFFATATRLETEGQLLLGASMKYQGYSEEPSRWSFPHILHASSAFPGMFRPVSGTQLHPGDPTPPTPLHLIDGGVFDNLPVIPAIDVLASVQDRENSSAAPDKNPVVQGSPRERLAARLRTPDLFVVVPLDQRPVQASESRSHNFLQQARLRSSGEKLASLSAGARRLRPLLEALSKSPQEGPKLWDELVTYRTIIVEPQVLNGTFHFDAAVGLEDERLDRSIVDGCYQTLRSVAAAYTADATAPSLQKVGCRRLVPTDEAPPSAPICPHFEAEDGRPLVCPMDSIPGRSGRTLYGVCARRNSWPDS